MAQLAIVKQMSRQESRTSAGNNEAHEQTGIEAQLAIIKQMSMQVSSSSAGDYQAEEQAGVARLSWRLSGR